MQLCTWVVGRGYRVDVFIRKLSLFVGFIMAWGQGDKEFAVLSFKIIMLHWTSAQTLNNWLFFANCHRKNGFSKFYGSMDDLNQKLQRIGVERKSSESRQKRNQAIILAVSLCLGTLNVALKIWDLSTYEMMDPLFGSSLMNRTDSFAIYLGLKIFSQSSYVLVMAQWIFYIGFYISICYSLWATFSQFNKFLSERVEKSKHDTVLQIESYRNAHLELCALVRSANGLFTIMLTNFMFNCTTSVLLLLYQLAASTPDTALGLFSLAYWLGGNIVHAGIYIFAAQLLHDQVGATYVYFYDVYVYTSMSMPRTSMYMPHMSMSMPHTSMSIPHMSMSCTSMSMPHGVPTSMPYVSICLSYVCLCLCHIR